MEIEMKMPLVYWVSRTGRRDCESNPGLFLAKQPACLTRCRQHVVTGLGAVKTLASGKLAAIVESGGTILKHLACQSKTRPQLWQWTRFWGASYCGLAAQHHGYASMVPLETE